MHLLASILLTLCLSLAITEVANASDCICDVVDQCVDADSESVRVWMPTKHAPVPHRQIWCEAGQDTTCLPGAPAPVHAEHLPLVIGAMSYASDVHPKLAVPSTHNTDAELTHGQDGFFQRVDRPPR